jgi:hypothetical protein
MSERKKKNQKERNQRKGKLVETAAAEQIDQGGLRQYFLGDLLRCLENPAGFSTATTGPAAVTTTTDN